MIKLLSIFLAFFNTFSIEDKYICPKDLYVDSYEVIDKCNDYILYKDNDIYYIEKEELLIELEGEVISFYQDSKIVVLSRIDGFLSLLVYENNGTLRKKILTKIEDGFLHKGEFGPIILGNCHLDKNNKITTDSNICIFDYNINQYIIFGGDKDEYLISSTNNNNDLYLLITKEKTSEEPFGNQSTNIICKVSYRNIEGNKTYKIDEIKHLSEELIFKKVSFINDLLYIFANNSILLFDNNLSYLQTKILDDYDYGYVNNFIVTFKNNVCKIYDNITLRLLTQITDDFDKGKVRIIDNKFLCYKDKEAYYFDIVSTEMLYVPKECYLDYECLLTKSFFGDSVYVEKQFETYFDKTLMGLFPFKIYFQTVGNIMFAVMAKYEITPKVNLTNNMVYPSGYAISFNGDAKVDDEYIYQQSRIYDEGLHHLVLEGCNMSYELDFYISNDQIPIVEKENKEGIKIKANTPYTITYQISNWENLIYKETVIKGMVNATTTFDNGLLTINIDKVNVEKDYQDVLHYDYILFVDKIIFEKNGKEVFFYLHQLYKFNLINDDLNLNDDYNDCVFSYRVDDENQMIKALEVDMIIDGVEKEYVYPIANNNIKIDNQENIIIHVYFLIDDGSGIYNKKYLFSSNIKGNDLFSVTTSYHDYLEEVKIDCSNSQDLLMLVKENKVVYDNTKINIQKTIVYFGIGIVFGGLCGFLARKLLYKRKDNF